MPHLPPPDGAACTNFVAFRTFNNNVSRSVAFISNKFPHRDILPRRGVYNTGSMDDAKIVKAVGEPVQHADVPENVHGHEAQKVAPQLQNV